MCADGGAMVTDALWLAARGRSKGTGGTERARFTLTGVDVILARLWRKKDEQKELRQKGRERKRRVQVTEPVRSPERKRETG